MSASTPSDNRLADKIVVVTGASRGIGRAIAVRCAQMGATVVINYCASDAQAQETLELVKQAGGANARLCKADISIAAEAKRLIDTVLAEFQRIDILINNAGIQRAVLVNKMTDEDWHQVINTNLSSVFYLCRAALPAMYEARRGHIVNIGSASGFTAHKGSSSYVASKYGLIGLTKCLALECADKGIQVNAVAPGVTDTDMISGLPEAARERLIAGIPMKRVASPEEVAAMVAFIITDASYSTGNFFHVSGGLIMG